MAALRILENEGQVQEKVVAAAEKYLQLANTRYIGGVTSYLEVTNAQFRIAELYADLGDNEQAFQGCPSLTTQYCWQYHSVG